MVQIGHLPCTFNDMLWKKHIWIKCWVVSCVDTVSRICRCYPREGWCFSEDQRSDATEVHLDWIHVWAVASKYTEHFRYLVPLFDALWWICETPTNSSFWKWSGTLPCKIHAATENRIPFLSFIKSGLFPLHCFSSNGLLQMLSYCAVKHKYFANGTGPCAEWGSRGLPV